MFYLFLIESVVIETMRGLPRGLPIRFYSFFSAGVALQAADSFLFVFFRAGCLSRRHLANRIRNSPHNSVYGFALVRQPPPSPRKRFSG